MDEVSPDIYRLISEYLPRVRDCLHFELAVQVRLYDKSVYVKRFEKEPLSNTFRFFRKGQLRTYKVPSYISDGITYSDVSVAPICRTFQCKHKLNVTPSQANHWVLSCITNGDNSGVAYITGV